MALIGSSGRPLSGQSGSQPAAAGPYVKETSLDTFAADVLEACARCR